MSQPMLEYVFNFFPMEECQVANVLGKPVLCVADLNAEGKCVMTTMVLREHELCGNKYSWFEYGTVLNTVWPMDTVKYFAFLPAHLQYQNGNTCRDIEICKDAEYPVRGR